MTASVLPGYCGAHSCPKHTGERFAEIVDRAPDDSEGCRLAKQRLAAL